MKHFYLPFLIILSIFFSFNSSAQAPDSWTQKADFGGNYRVCAVGFSIGAKGYIGTGVDKNNVQQNDFWEYDTITNAWSQKANFGGTGRLYAVGFSIGAKGYIGTGQTDGPSVILHNDFWEYDPVSNSWTRKADFGGSARSIAVGFSIGNKGYLGTGEDTSFIYTHNYTKDFWEYDPGINTWTKKADFGGAARDYAVGFGIDGKGYIGIGEASNYYSDFWEYDTTNNTWTRKADFAGLVRFATVGFNIGNKGYVGTGDGPYDMLYNDFWEYNPTTNIWSQKTNFGGIARCQAVGFSIGSKGYIGTGDDIIGVLIDDFWEYTPSSCTATAVTFTPCFDTITTVNARPIKLKGGIPLGGTYSGPGVNSSNGVFFPSVAGVGVKTITYTYTNADSCSGSESIQIHVQSSGATFTCGNNLSDIRDNQVYSTVKIGSQCWMATNLNYGTFLSSAQDQRDNCLWEKYCYNDLPANCTTLGALYQWDELMQYDETPADQGFCPPGWHIPTENEWNTLFINWINNAMAGEELKYTGNSGFNALLSGTRHIDRNWDYNNFSGFYWSSTNHGDIKAWAHGMNSFDPSVSLYPSSRSNAFSVRCLQDTGSVISLPTVTSDSVSFAQCNTTAYGDVISDGGSAVTDRGICYSTTANPTISDTHFSCGNGIGQFSGNLAGLIPNTTYYIRAYATNILGTGYGADLTYKTASGNYYFDSFTGDTLNTGFWQILDLTSSHEPGLNLYVNDSLFIVRGPNNNNNGWYGVESILEYPCFKSAKIDFRLDTIHNSQDHKIRLVTPFGAMGYYNYDHSWWCDYYKADGTYGGFIAFNFAGYNPGQKYSFRISTYNGTLKFEWDSGTGFQTEFTTTDYSFYKLIGTTLYKKVNVTSSDRGTLKCDNFELNY